MDGRKAENPDSPRSPDRSARWACAEWLLILLLFFVLAGTPPPDVNEAHYLGKAKHYWDPQWCPRDQFLNSADAHVVFYWTVGWLTRYFSLPIVAWMGRFVTWGLLAWSWRRLSVALIPARLFAPLTAALFAMLLRWGHMAGEWVIGGVEAKGFAFVLLFLALEALTRHRWRTACLLLGGATALHVLIGGWSLVALSWCWFTTPRERRPSLGTLLGPLAGAGALALPGLLPALALSWSVDPELVREANHIYVFERLSHHLVFHDLPHLFMARHAGIVLAWLTVIYAFPQWVQPRTEPLAPLNRFTGGAVLIALAGAVLDQSLLYFRPFAAAVLRYYWFRLSDTMVPLTAACLWGICLYGWSHSNPIRFVRALIVTLALVCLNVGDVAFDHWRDPRPGADVQAMGTTGMSRKARQRQYQDWVRVCAWIKNWTPPDAIFLTPRHQQTFKWYAERSEVVCAKDIPQDAAGIVQWRRRLDMVFPPQIGRDDLAAHGEQRLRELAQEFGFRYLVVDRIVSHNHLTFPRLYPESGSEASIYEVYLVKPKIHETTR